MEMVMVMIEMIHISASIYFTFEEFLGGLGYVVGGLSKALARRGLRVMGEEMRMLCHFTSQQIISLTLCLMVDSGSRLIWSGHKDGKTRSGKMDNFNESPIKLIIVLFFSWSCLLMVMAPRYGNCPGPQDSGVRKTYKVDGQVVWILFSLAVVCSGTWRTFMDGTVWIF